ncbi:MAG TPA: NADH-quinone oxidoreductase subunit C [bacterium]|nr:NADH-quinone oxidoreductase subunit C [bacterium]HQO34006.1 NADH-quinone oxidoreductase subunit C [bacterium]HQP97103.1 NADH-quinone oxidoreductase subunit C [bacterium]
MNDEVKAGEPNPPLINNSMKFRTEDAFPVLRSRFGDTVRSLSDTQPDRYILVQSDALPEICKFLRDDPDWQCNLLHCITGLDQAETLAVVYHLFSMPKRHFVVLKIEVSKDSPIVPTLADIWPSADWLERETFDLLGIVFEGHPDLRRILLPDEWIGHPLRKDYEMPTHEKLRGLGL